MAEGIEVLGLNVRSYNALKRAGVHTVEQLSGMSVDEIMSIRFIGTAATMDILTALERKAYRE